MNLEDLTVTGTNQVHVTDSLNSALMKLSVKRNENTPIADTNDLIVYVDKQNSSTPTSERKQYVFELSNPLQYSNGVSDEFLLQLKIINNDVKFVAVVERNLSIADNVYTVLEESLIEELECFPITLFEGENYIYTNYTNATINVIYPKNDEMNKLYLNNAIFGGHRLNASGDFGLDDIYFKDAFTKTGDELNLEVDNAEIKCLSSKNNKFSLDENGNLVVNSISANTGLGEFDDAFTRTGTALNLEVDNAEIKSLSSKNNKFSLDENGNLVVNSITANTGLDFDIDNQSICNLIYPVGSIYMSVNTTNPSTLFGGTWTRLKDRFLLGAGDTYSTNGATGGSATHTLTVDQMPSHTHTQNSHTHTGRFKGFSGISTSTNGWYFGRRIISEDSYDGTAQTTNGTTATNQNTGGGQAHNNMPPYLVVYMWKRTA